MSSDKKSNQAAAAAASGRSQVTGVKLGKGARRALTKNADCVDEFLSIVSSAPTAAFLTVALEKEALTLARVMRSVGCGRLQVMLEDGTEANVPISGTIKFKGRSNTKADRANCMCADDVIVIRGSFAAAKVSPAAAAFIRKHYEAKGIKTPRGFFSSAVEEEEEKQMGGNVGGGGGFEFDRDDELAGEEAEVAALRAQNARAIALRTGKAVSVDSEDSDVDIEDI